MLQMLQRTMVHRMYFFIVQIHNYAVVDLVCFSREVKLSPWFLGLLEIKLLLFLL